MLTVKKHLSLKPLIEGFKKAIDVYADKRRQNSTDYTIQDTALSVLACMFYKSKNMLKFQATLKKRLYRNNLETQFDVHNTPCYLSPLWSHFVVTLMAPLDCRHNGATSFAP